MNPSKSVGLAALAAVLASGSVSAHSAAGKPPQALPANFTLNVSITPAARAVAARAKKAIKMDVVYEGEPKPRFLGQADAETGNISLGHEKMEIPPAGGPVTLGRGLNRGRLQMLAKPVDVKVSVFIGDGGDGFLNCTGHGLVTSDVTTVATFANFARTPRTISCALPKDKRPS